MPSGENSAHGPDLIWLRQEPGARRPARSRAQIAAAAIAIADEEGLEAVSMRRVAQALDAGTMTLYHYVRNKDELLALMHDAVMADVLVPAGELPVDWRGALTTIARRSREAFRRHPWTLEGFGETGVGPNAMRHFEQSLAAVENTKLETAQRLELISLVDDYVIGYSLRERIDCDGEEGRAWMQGAFEFFQSQLGGEEFPHIRALLGEDAQEGTRRVLDVVSADRFEKGLAQLLDGVEAGMPGSRRRRPARTAAGAPSGRATRRSRRAAAEPAPAAEPGGA